MEIDKDKIQTLEEAGETAPMDVATDRAEAEMKQLEREAKKQVAESLREEDTRSSSRETKRGE